MLNNYFQSIESQNRKDLNKNLSKFIGLKLRIKRIQKGLSLDYISSMVDICYPSLVNFEKGNTNLNFGMVFKICSVLNIEVSEVLPKIKDNLLLKISELELEYKNILYNDKHKNHNLRIVSITKSLDR